MQSAKVLLFITFCLHRRIISIALADSNSVIDSTSEWTPFCNEVVYYKPYVRIWEGRNGPLIKDVGPGFYETKGMENLYICANGLVFLYFKIHEREHGDIFDDAVMQYASHYCGFYNGKPGPGIGDRESTLVAILLLGHSDDYRQVAVQMFTAPLKSPITNITANFTSLAIINTDGECILEKGNERARIRIKGNPSEEVQKKTYNATEEHHTTICRLDGNLLMQDDASKIPLDSELASKDEALHVLAQNESFSDLKLMGCYKYPLLDRKIVQIIERRKHETTLEGFDIGKGKSELNPEDGAGLKFWTAERIQKYGNPTKAPADNATLQGEVDTKNGTLQTELAKNKTDQDKKVITDTTADLNLAILKLKLAPYLTHYQSLFESAKTAAKNATETWEAVEKFVLEDALQTILHNYTQVQERWSLYEHQSISEPYNSKLVEMTENATRDKDTFREQLWQKSLEVGPLISKAEVMSARRASYVAEARLAMEKIQKVIEVGEKSKHALDSQWDYQQSRPVYKDIVVSVKNPAGATATENPACLTFERKEDQCKAVKPSAKRACQLAKIKVTGAGDWPGGDGDKWRDEVLEWMGKIFAKGCNRLNADFAKGISNILKGYLIKKPEMVPDKDNNVMGVPVIERFRQNYITNYKITKPEDLYPPLPAKDAAPWDEIIELLKTCEGQVEPLQFSVDTSSTAPPRITFGGATLSNTVEQADMEFSFNWAIDSHFRIFGTVLGLCLKQFEGPIAKKFYEGYTTSFLDPIRPIWLSNRDNPLFKVILGQYYTTGKGDVWTRKCMDASFVLHKKPNMRPLRNLYVNGFTEPNFIAKGSDQGSRGPFYS